MKDATPVPCWKCQRDDEAAHVIEHQRGPVMAVKCNECGQRGPFSGNWDDVYRLWNDQNDPPSAPPVDAEKLAAAIYQILMARPFWTIPKPSQLKEIVTRALASLQVKP